MSDLKIQPIVFAAGQGPAFIELKRMLIQQVEDHFDLGFGPHQAQRKTILEQIKLLMSLDNIKAALYPERPLTRADVSTLTPRIKQDEVGREELARYGVLPSYDESTHLYASLYVLPAPLDQARQASCHPEEYARTRPYIQEAALCHLPNRDPAYYVVVGAYQVTGSMVVDARWQGPVGYYHLAPACFNGSGEALRTRSVRFMDGMKIYIPIQVQEGDQVFDRTFVLSTTVSVWEGFKGWVKKQQSEETHATVYGEVGVGEILSVLKRLH